MAVPLTIDDWVDVATAAVEEGGVSAVAVLPLAERLGTTRGSFYWHFRNREELLEATLARWEERSTADVIAELEALPEPRERLERLFRAAFENANDGRVMAALHAATHEPVVAIALQRISERRLRFLASCFTGLGLTPARARRRALAAYAAYTGTAQLQFAGPDVAPSGRAVRSYVEDLVGSLTGD